MDLFVEYTTEQLDSNIAAIERRNPHFPEIWDRTRTQGCQCTSCEVSELPGEWDEYPAWNEYTGLRWLRGDN